MVEDSEADFTERLESEDVLRRINRALRAIMECDEAMVRVSDEKELLKEICRIIVEVGKYKLAWVGYAQQDEKKTVLPVAYDGFEDGYLRGLDITWADTESGRGPTGTSIRTGKPFISKNIATDPKFLLWRDEALKRGYKSTISIPLKSGEMTFGALNMYSSDPDVFDTEEVKLLMGLGRDLAFGIVALRTRQEHEKAEEKIKDDEHFLENIFSSIQDGISVLDKDMNILRVNKTMERWYKHALPLVGKKCYEAYHLRKHRCEVCPTYQTLKTGKPAYETVPKTSTGGKIVGTLDLYTFPLIDTDTGQIKGVIEYVRDISDRKKTEQQLEHLFELSLDMLCVAGFDGRFKQVNPAWTKKLGWSKEELLDKPWLQLIHPDDRYKTILATDKLKKGKSVISFQNRFMCKDHSYRLISWNAFPHVEEGLIFAVVRDVTGQK